jgi:hypothetical protein
MQADHAQQQLGQRFTAAPAAEAVLCILTQSSTDCDMLICAFKAVHTLASDNREVVVSVNAGASMVAAVEAHCSSSSSSDLALWSLKALTQLAVQPCNKLSLTTAFFYALVVSIMTSHGDVADVALWSLYAVHTLAKLDAGSRSCLSTAGACEACIAAMDKHSTKAHVVEHGCCAVYMLAFNSDANATKLGTAGACKAAVAALAAHGSVAGVVQWALKAVGVLAADSVNKSRLRIGAAAETIQSVCALHVRNVAVQDLAKTALEQLRSDSTAQATALQGMATAACSILIDCL